MNGSYAVRIFWRRYASGLRMGKVLPLHVDDFTHGYLCGIHLYNGLDKTYQLAHDYLFDAATGCVGIDGTQYDGEYISDSEVL